MISSWDSLGRARSTRQPYASTVRHRRGLAPASSVVTTGTIKIKKGEGLYHEGDQPTTPYLVLSGVLRIMVPTAAGRDRLADLAGRGDILGTAVFDSTAHAESVIAADDAEVASIDLAATLARQQGRADLSAALVRQLTRSRELADDLGLPMGARICRILARVALRLGNRVQMGAEVGPTANLEWRHLPFSLTHDDVALLAGCARVTATRILGELKEAQVLDGHRGNYAVVPSALEAAADRYVYEVL